MADRAISHADIMRGRPHSFRVNGNSAEILALSNIKDGIVKVTEEIKESIYEVEDATEIVEPQGRKATIEFVYSEVDATDIAALDDADEIVIVTAVGGANGTGKTLTMSNCDKVYSQIDDLKTKIVATKATTDLATLPYTITDNPA